MAGWKRQALTDQQRRGGQVHKGKMALSWELYVWHCNWMLVENLPEYVFAHCFLMLVWLLMVCMDKGARIHIKHIRLAGNSLSFFFMHTKTDQEGQANLNKA